MEKPIFKDDIEVNDFLDDCFPMAASEYRSQMEGYIKRSGYIRKDIVEEAEEMFQRWQEEKTLDLGDMLRMMENTLNKQHEAIQILKRNLQYKRCTKTL